MADVKFEDYSFEVKAAMDAAINAALEECAGELEAQAARNTRRDTGETASKWAHHVDKSKHIATVGNPLENAIWEEFGTGEHALAGNGRKGGWSYKDAKGNWHHTRGKTPSRAFWKAMNKLKSKIIERLQQSMKGL